MERTYQINAVAAKINPFKFHQMCFWLNCIYFNMLLFWQQETKQSVEII